MSFAPEESLAHSSEEAAVQFTVLGKAQPAGSKTGYVVNGRAIITDANAKSKPWKQEVASVASEAMQGRDIFVSALLVEMRFYRARPKGHFGSGKNAEVIKNSAPRYPVSAPDVLKTARGVEDAMTSIVYKDDAQIVVEWISKHYGLPERVEVHVQPLRDVRVELPALA